MFSTISFLFAAFITVSAVRRDSIWTINLTPASDEYEGRVEILAVFTDGKQHSVTLPSTKYEKAKTATFEVGMASPGPLQMAYVRTHGVCPIGLIPLSVLRLRQIELISRDTNTTFTKYVNDLAIKDACQSTKSLGTAVQDFDQVDPAFCMVDGKKYADGEQFDMGCVAKCKCIKGNFGCVDMCPTVALPTDQKCHFVHLPGQCCDTVRCEEDKNMNSCTSNVPKYDIDDIRRGPTTRRYPWSVLLCTDDKCSQVYGGIIVGSRHVLTFAPDMSFFTNLRLNVGQYIAPGINGTDDFSPLRVVNVTAHPDFVNADSPVADSASRLQLLQVDKSFEFDTQTQAANLPFNKQQCAELAKENCSLMSVGWDRTDDQDQEIRQWFLHAEKTNPDQNACKNGATIHPKMVTVPKVRGDQRICISGLERVDCTGPLGGAVVSSRGTVDFLVGMLDPDVALLECVNRGTASVLPVCKYADWISATITAGNF